MESQIDELLNKYWKGESSLEEEKLLKGHFKENPSLTGEGAYFRYLSNEKNTTLTASANSKKAKKNWLSAAATVTVGLITALLVFNNANKDPFAEEDPEKAMEATRKALLMIGSSLNQCQNHTLELIKINKAKEELGPEGKENFENQNQD